MAKKHRKKEQLAAVSAAKDHEEEDPITSQGWKVIVSGLGVLILGFLVLTRTDPQGRNWASDLSPLLILGGYGLVACGILLAPPAPPPSSGT